MKPLLALVTAGLLLAFAGCTKPKAADQPAVMTREEFRDAVMGKNMDEVLKAVGKPDHTSETAGVGYWRYDERTRDTVTGKVDRHALVVFEGGGVVKVDFLTDG